MASDIRYGTPESKVGFLFVKVGLPGCDMGACSMLPRIVGHGRAAELLYTGRLMAGEEALAMGFYNQVCAPDEVLGVATKMAQKLSAGPTFANAITKRQMHKEWDMGINEAIDSEGQAMAIAMYSKDFRRAYEAFTSKQRPEFKGD
jgi:enoyl-CoA hydratase/carnithine racemase